MITTASILQGLQVCTGPFPIHLFLLLTMIDLRAPSDCHKSTRDPDTLITGRVSFYLLILNHIITALHKLLFVYEFPDSFTFKPMFERYNKRIRFLMQGLQLVIFSEISYYWVFVPWVMSETDCCDTQLDDSLHQWKKFKFFLLLECSIFAMNLFAAMVFMLVRSMFDNQVSWDIEEEDKWEMTDAIVTNQEQIDLFQQVFTPAMISLCLLFTHGDCQDCVAQSLQEPQDCSSCGPFWPYELGQASAVSQMVTTYFIVQAVQVVLTLLCIFVKTHLFRGNQFYNDWMPTVIGVLVTIDAAVIPIGVIIYFLISVIWNPDIRNAVIFPWLLFYPMLCVWTFLYSYLVIARANRDAVLYTVRTERKWAEDRKNGLQGPNSEIDRPDDQPLLDNSRGSQVSRQSSTLSRSQRRPRSHASRGSVVDESEIGEEPPLEAYVDRKPNRIGRPCPLTEDLFTLCFMANVEHWYNLPFEHSEADMDYLVNNILTLVAAHILLITAVLMNAINAKQPAKLEDLYDMQLVVIS